LEVEGATATCNSKLRYLSLEAGQIVKISESRALTLLTLRYLRKRKFFERKFF
jgi:hypothetical protein